MKRYKILLVSAAANMIWQFNKRNIELLREIGFEVLIATNYRQPGTLSLKERDKMLAWLERNDVKTFQVDFERGVGNLKTNLAVIRQLRQIISENGVDVVHSQSPIGGVLARIASKLESKKSIYTAHGFHFFKGAPLINWFVYFPIELILSGITDYQIVINDEDYQAANRLFCKDITKIPGVGVKIKAALESTDMEKSNNRDLIRAELGIGGDEFVMLCVAELSQRKNQIAILRAMNRINNKNIHLILAGIGNEFDYLVHQARMMGLQDRIHFLGYRTDVNMLHHASDLNVFPSKQEGLALGGIEAICNGLYIVGSDIRGVRDYIFDEKMGRLIQPNNVDQLANVIAEESRRKVRVSNNDIARLSDFDVSNVDDLMHEFYLRVKKEL